MTEGSAIGPNAGSNLSELNSVLIVGTGAMANLYGAALSAAGLQVAMLGTWSAGLQALRTRGIRLVDPDGSERTISVKASSNPADFGQVRHALVLVKSWQTARAAGQLAACLDPQGVALTLQNGYGNRETLAASLGAERVALGVTTAGATLLEPGKVKPGGAGAITVENHPRIGPLAAGLRAAGFPVELTAHADGLVWSKLVINSAINPLTALLRVPNGELLERAAARSLMGELARETAAVATAAGIELTFSDPAGAAEDVARRTSGNHSSMYQDVLRGAPTEIDAICGAIDRIGQMRGAPTPLNRTMWSLISALANHPPT